MRFVFLAVAIGVTMAGSVSADENVRQVQTKLSDEGLYSGEIDGAYSSDLSAALTRYQVRNGLPITGQLDAETSDALGAKSAVTKQSEADSAQSSEVWRRLRKAKRGTSTTARRSETVAAKAQETSSSRTDEAAETSAETRPRSAPATTAAASSESAEPAAGSTTVRTTETTKPASSALAEGTAESTSPATTSANEFSAEHLRDYVAAFVLAGLDKNVGAEVEFFADRVEYYDEGLTNREKIREDLKRYDDRWPERHFWVAGAINIEPQSDNRVQVTFPLGFRLRNGGKQSSGKINKTLVLEPAGDDLQIVAVNESKAR